MAENRKINNRQSSGKGENSEYRIRRTISNVWVRNIVLAISLLIICLFIVQILLSVFTRHNRYKDVPDFKGMQLVEAQRIADENRLRIEINDSLYVPVYDGGIVLEQKPAAGSQVKSGRRIFVTVNSYHQKMVTVPYVTGYSLRQAKNNLESVGLEISELHFVEDIAANYVLGQKVNGREVNSDSGMQVEVGSGVELTIGMNAENTSSLMPDLTGLSLREAKGRIWENGFNVGKTNFDEGIDMLTQNSSKVYRQTPQPGEYVGMGSKVTIFLTLDEQKVTESAKRVKEEMAKRTEELRNAMEDVERMESAQDEIESAIRDLVGN